MIELLNIKYGLGTIHYKTHENGLPDSNLLLLDDPHGCCTSTTKKRCPIDLKNFTFQRKYFKMLASIGHHL